jgi:hypothetical protein
MRSWSPSAALVSFAFAGLATAQTIVVSGGGAALQQAVVAAPVGAILDVLPGSYTPVVATRGLRISLRQGATVSAPVLSGVHGVRIWGVPAGEQFVLEGSGTVTAIAIGLCAGDVVVNGIDHAEPFVPVTVGGCTGAVTFHRTTCRGAGAVPLGWIVVDASTNVSFTACTLPCMTVQGSRVGLNGCTNWNAHGSRPGIDVVSGSVVVDGGTVAGGLVGFLPTPAPGIRLAQGEVVLTGSAVIRPSPVPIPSAAIETTGGSLRRDPSVLVLGAITGPAVVQHVEIPSLTVAHTANALAVTLTAGLGSVVFTFAGLPTSPVPTPWGDAWLSPLDPILDVVVMPPSGVHSFVWPFASVPPFAQLVVQSVALTPSSLTLGAPVRFAWD